MLAPGTHGHLTAPLGNGTPLNEVLLGVKAEVIGSLWETTDGTVYVFKTPLGGSEYRGFEWEFTPTVSQQPVQSQAQERARRSGYDESPCPRCGSFKMKRAGACLCCDECGETSGCG